MITFMQISKRYGTIRAVDDVSLVVQPGELLALVGPNGAGKTTLLRLLLGLIAPSGGTASVAGYDVQHNGAAARRQLGYLPQRAVLYGNLSVAENLAFLAALHALPLQRVADVIALMQLDAVAQRPARTLSGGTAQRLGLAQALLADPPALVLDEPTVSLDPQSVASFKQLLRTLQGRGKTILLSSHILGDVQELADRVAILHAGRLIAIDSIPALAQRCSLPEQIHVVLAAVSGDEPELLARAGAEAHLDGDTLQVQVPLARKPAVIQALLHAGLPIRDLRSSSPSLEAIFMHLVGQAQH
ncbi:heme ABC exporter ATP-binding protein CcmA [Candidatus Gracilibacteria bacterium]|nr:heme ABC exporter ATP-binding protein CcmA [Candidatus Gracilibacteria bacterium]